MNDIVTKRSEIPDAPYYILTNDTFMSDWGPARGKINTLILPCESYAEAIKVKNYVQTRSDQHYERIVSLKPRLKPGHLYQVKTRAVYPHWYGLD